MSDVGDVNEWVSVAKSQEGGGPDGCVPRFYNREVQNKKRTNEDGVARFDLVEYVEIFIPGEKHNRPDRKVTDEDRARWPGAYEKFKRTQEEVMEGTPLEQWPYLNRAQVAEFKAEGVMTIESLASMADGLVDRLGMGARDIVKRAQAHLQPAGETEKQLREENRELQQKVDQLLARIVVLEEAPKKRGPGRPPKVRHDTENDMSGRA